MSLSLSRALALKAEATQSEDVKTSLATALKSFGKIDVLVNNVGLFTARDIMTLSETEWEPMFNVNAKAPFLCSRAVGKHMTFRLYRQRSI